MGGPYLPAADEHDLDQHAGTLTAGPLRISELAEREGTAQRA